MANLMIFIVLTFSIGVVQCLFNPYPRYTEFFDGGDTGEPIFLTEYIEKGEFELAKNLSLVNHDDMKWLTSYAGYLTVNKTFNSNMFFWFFPAKLDQAKAPVVLWLQGGPGASSLFGLFQENGPFFVTTKKGLKPRKYSWHLNHNLLYIDNPVGTGFSFTENDGGYAKNEKDVGKDLFNALRQFFTLFSELRGNAFYVTGESYAGKYVPAVAHTIYKNSKSTDPKDKINLQGLAIGNGLSDPVNQMQYGDYLYQLGLIDTNGLKIFNDAEKEGIDCINKRDFECAFRVFDKLIDGDETTDGSIFKNLTGFNTYFNYLRPNGDAASDALMGEFLQMSATRKAIHVGNYTFHDLEGENKVEEHLTGDIMASVKDWVVELLEHYKVLIYNGQLDIIVAYPLTENYLKKMKFNAADDYKTAKRYIWKVDNEIAGYVKHAGNLTEVLVRSAGHMAPADQPKWVLDMLMRMTTGKGFFEHL
ncbi:venom serine carboxypeptidase-like [Bradysia coprophila]|uniref:venom serine carboxypeptidase-like n=1 Tax=Bradysia coprophila TaxID=38358 RepID=UPI00187DB224|nr:venom serine carboxypeptidase-like [Bradysia coprophila]